MSYVKEIQFLIYLETSLTRSFPHHTSLVGEKLTLSFEVAKDDKQDVGTL